MPFSNAVSPNATVHFTFFFVPLATLLSLRVLPEFKKKAVWTRAYGWWSIGVASSILSWMWKTIEMEEGFQNSCLGVLSYNAEGRGAWKGGRRMPDRCVPREGGIALGPRPVGTETRTWIFFYLARVQPEDFLCEELTTLSSPRKF